MAIAIGFLVSLVLAFFLKGTKDKPRRWGGLAVLLGMGTAVFCTQGLAGLFTLRVFWLCLGLLFLMGVIDDLHPLKPFMKLGFQVIAVLVFLFLTPPAVLPFHGTGFWPGELVLFIWLLGITNALNLLDNMDGLTAGVGAVAALGLAFVGLGPQYVLFPLAGALVGFLVFNHSPAKIYLGDSGSHLVGFSLATLPLFGLPQSQSWIPVVVLVVPIIDTTFVTVTRLMRGVSPFRGGKDHISHRLVEKGWSKSQVAWMVYAVTGLFAIGATWGITLTR